MPQPKAKPKIEVILPTATAKKHSVRYETDADGVDLDSIYLKLNGCRILGNPSQVKVTVEAHEPEK